MARWERECVSWQVAQLSDITGVAPSELVDNDGHWFYYLRRVVSQKSIDQDVERSRSQAKSWSRRNRAF